jgi:hypothetical protein
MIATAKLDLFKHHKDEYVTPKQPALVEISPARYLVIDGRGQPGGDEFQTAIGALYGMAFTIKMTRKIEGLGDYAVCKLEALWWDTDRPRDDRAWKMMIRTPDFVGKTDLKSAVAKLVEKKKGDGADRVKLEKLEEERCVQALHVGPYEQEYETIATMMAFAEKNGLEVSGRHHEIYLSDPRRVPPERLKTILRYPVAGNGK